MMRCALIMMGCLLAAGVAHAEPLFLEADKLSAIQLSGMTSAAVTDVALIERELAATLSDIEALERMVEMLKGANHRKALKGQIKAMKVRVQGLQGQLKGGAHPVKLAEPPKVAIKPVARPCPPCAHRRHGLAPQPMSAEDFKVWRKAIKDQSFRKDKLALLKSTIGDRHLDVGQAIKLAKVFTYSKDRVEAMVLAYPRLVDPEEAFRIYNVFEYSRDRERFQKQIDAIKAKQEEEREARRRRRDGRHIKERLRGKRHHKRGAIID